MGDDERKSIYRDCWPRRGLACAPTAGVSRAGRVDFYGAYGARCLSVRAIERMPADIIGV